MKFKASALCLALLCGSLLLPLSSAFAPKPKSKSVQKRKSASAKHKSALARTPSPTPTPTLQGSYTLINLAEATDKVKKAIEASAKSMPWGTQGLTRSRLQETNLPPPQRLVISYTSSEVIIETDLAGKIKTSLDGKPVPRSGHEVSTKWVNGSLERTFKASDGQRVNTYSLDADGKTLTLHVIGTRESSPRLKQPLEYQLSYRRN